MDGQYPEWSCKLRLRSKCFQYKYARWDRVRREWVLESIPKRMFLHEERSKARVRDDGEFDKPADEAWS